MIIKILASGQYIKSSGKEPKEGCRYSLEEADSPTNRQNKAFHALVAEYFVSGLFSYNVKTFEEFRNAIKGYLGPERCEKIYYADLKDGEPVIVKVDTVRDIPDHVLSSKRLRERALKKPMSWSDYTKKERTETIDRLVSEMHHAGVSSKKFYEILEGMNDAGTV